VTRARLAGQGEDAVITSDVSKSMRVRTWVRLSAAAAATVAGVCIAPTARADRSWTGAASPDWFEPGNWSAAGVPSGADRVFFPSAATIANQPTVGGTDATIEALLIDNGGGAAYSLGGTAVLSIQAPARALFTGIQLIGGGTTTVEPVLRPVRDHVVDVQGTSTLQLNGGMTGVQSILKLGTGVLELNYRSNNFMGDFQVGEGTLQLGANSGSPAIALRSSVVTINSPGVLSIPAAAAGQAMAGGFRETGTVSATGKRLTIFPLSQLSFGGTITAGVGGQSVQVQGAGTQVFTGNTTLDGSIILAQSGNLTLGGNATFNPTTIVTPTAPSTSLQNNSALLAKGGTLVLDNSVVNNNDRIQGNGYIMTAGGGGLTLIGNAAGTSEQLNQPLMAFSGAGKIRIVHNAGNAAATVLTAPGLGQGNTTATMDFSSNVPFGAGNAPRVILQTADNFNFFNAFQAQTTIVMNGTLGIDGGTFPDSTGMYTVNGTDFAGYDNAAGIVPVATTAMPTVSGGAPAANVLLSGSANTAATLAGTNFVVNTLKIAPTNDSQSLDISGGGDLEVSGYSLAGPRKFTISSTGGGKLAGRHTRYFHVADPDGTLVVTADIGGLGPTDQPANTQIKPISKAGPGVLELAGANSFAANSTNINVLEGTLRAAIDGNPSSLPVGLPNANTTLRFRGGVFEIKGGGTFSRFVGTGGGRVNWGAAATEGGSGGFAAIGAPARVDLNTLDTRDELRWRASSFVFEDNALFFGSHTADNVIEWFDHIGLNAGTTTDTFYSMREFRAFDNPNSTTDRAIITGEIRSFSAENGGLNADFLKTGDGILELNAAQNTYLGNTIVKEGTLIVHANQASAGYMVKSGRLQIHGSLPPTSDFRLDGGDTVIDGTHAVRAIAVGGNATLTLTRPDANVAVLKMKNLSVEGGRLDLRNNAAVVDYEPDFIPVIFDVRRRIREAYNGGAWDGPGITSSEAAENPGTALGYGEASAVLGISGAQTGTFLGQEVDATSILIRYTRSGDANLNGAVNFEDLVALAQNYNTATGEAFWTQGDFNYDGNVNFADLVQLAQNYNTALPAPGTFAAGFEADLQAALAAVPEPSSVGLFVLLGCGRRCRRASGRIRGRALVA
jgi:autotransporter-associated beta strand protein